MGTTPTYGWPYPELTDPPDGAGQIKALATAIETTVKAPPSVTYTEAQFFTPATGWAGGAQSFGGYGCLATVKSGMATILINLKRTGANILSTANGDIVDTPLGTITIPALRPVNVPYVGIGIVISGFPLVCSVQPGGTVILETFTAANQTLSTNAIAYANLLFPVA